MKHNTRAYFIERVLPAYETFVNNYNNLEFGLRKDTFNAGNIAEALRDMPEHIFIEIGAVIGHKNANEYRQTISSKYKYYKIICDLANVVKHREITRNNPSFLNLDDVKESIAIVYYEDILGKYYKARKLLEVKLLDSSVYEVGELIHNSIILWSIQLINLGLIPSLPKLPELLPKLPSREDNRFDNNIIFLGNASENADYLVRTLKYEPDQNTMTEIKVDEKFENTKIDLTFKLDFSPFR